MCVCLFREIFSTKLPSSDGKKLDKSRHKATTRQKSSLAKAFSEAVFVVSRSWRAEGPFCKTKCHKSTSLSHMVVKWIQSHEKLISDSELSLHIDPNRSKLPFDVIRVCNVVQNGLYWLPLVYVPACFHFLRQWRSQFSSRIKKEESLILLVLLFFWSSFVDAASLLAPYLHNWAQRTAVAKRSLCQSAKRKVSDQEQFSQMGKNTC